MSTCFLPPPMQQPTTFLTKEKIGIGSEFTLVSKITVYAEYEAIWALHSREQDSNCSLSFSPHSFPENKRPR